MTKTRNPITAVCRLAFGILGLLQLFAPNPLEPIPAAFAQATDKEQQTAKSNPRVDAAIRATVAATPGFSGAVYYKHNDLENYLYFGDDGRGEKIGPHNNFAIASLAKHITSYLIVGLVHEGRLSFDSTLGEIFRLSANDAHVAKITVEQLTNHTSGFGQQPCTVGDNVSDMLDCATFDPKKAGKYYYSNFGYLLLGKVIEQMTGKPFEQVLEERVFTPRGLKSSGHAPNDNTALGTIPTLIGTKLTDDFTHHGYVYHPREIADGGMFFTLPDFVRWLDFLQNDDSSQDYLFALKRGTDIYRLGWIEREVLESHYTTHGGDLVGYRAIAYWNSSTTLVIMQNNDYKSGIDINTAILGAVVERCQTAKECLALLNEGNSKRQPDLVRKVLFSLANPWLSGLLILVIFGSIALLSKDRYTLLISSLTGVVAALLLSAMRLDYTLALILGVTFSLVLCWRWQKTRHHRGWLHYTTLAAEISLLVYLTKSTIEVWLRWW